MNTIIASMTQDCKEAVDAARCAEIDLKLLLKECRSVEIKLAEILVSIGETRTEAQTKLNRLSDRLRALG